MASTGSWISRRTWLQGMALGPVAAVLMREAGATEYASAAEVLHTVDLLEAEVAERLRAVGRSLASAHPCVASVLADLAHHSAERSELRRRLKLNPSGSSQGSRLLAPASLPELRRAQQALVYAHAEGLPALGDAVAVRVMARHIVDLARHLTVTDLWIEAEA